MSSDETIKALVQLVHALGLSDADRAAIEQLIQEHAGQPRQNDGTSTEDMGNSDELALPDDRVLGGSLWNPPISSPWKRYEDLGFIGRGGMGEVRRVRDRILGRVLAMKFLAAEARRTARARARFLVEARLTACLQHPGIVPVHDCGALEDGRLWFTMPEVRGRTLSAAIAVLHVDRRAGPAPELLRRLLDAYARTCEVVAYAHGHGVLHRDLKPDNVMLGEFGEVFVMDWGIAGTYARKGSEHLAEAALPLVGHHTQTGQVLGTPAYMAPEQARGAQDQLGPASDVYALGSMLYELLCGSPPFTGIPAAVRHRVLHGPPAPLASRCRGKVPPDLLAICERAMARAPDDRYPDAWALAQDVHAFLDGARRRERARALVAEARALEPEIAALRSRARRLRAQAEAMLGRLEPFAPAEEKAAGWAREDEARDLELTAATSEVAWGQKLRAALNETPDLDEAHEALADGYYAELCAAEEACDGEAAARAEALLSMHDRGRYAALLRGAGALTLVTEPEGAEVWLYRYTERQRRLALEPRGLLGRSPLRSVPLARGSYLLVIRSPGYRDVRYPVRIGRNEHWMGVRPGAREPFPVLLLPEQSLDPNDVYVPAGWFLSGGDPLASESLPRRHVWVDGFVIRRHPVTQAEYLAFLNALVDGGRGDEAEATCPRAARAVAGSSEVLLFLFARDRLGRFVPAPDATAAHAHHPVASVDWRAAAAYAAWWAARTGHPWRLAGELEREKAARGADGRAFPWGAQPEPTWACMVSSRPGPASPAPVDDYPVDESPYGVRGLAGNVRDWCAEVWMPQGPAVVDDLAEITPAAPGDSELRAIRGGAWSAAPPAMCRSAGRFAARPDELFRAVGFRLARPVGPRPGRG